MLLVFLSCLAIGTVGLLFSFLFDHDHVDYDTDAGGPGWMNLKVGSSFLLSFGAVGMLARANGWGVATSTAAGLGGGVGLGAFMWYLLAFLHGQQATSHQTMESMVGRIGFVEIAVRPLGEVAVGDQRCMARSSTTEDIAAGRRVRVVGVNGAELIVSPAE